MLGNNHLSKKFVTNIFSSEIELELTLELYWNDERLNVTDCDGFIDNSTLQRIWTPRPDIFHKSFIEKIKRIGGTTDFFSADPEDFYWYLELYVGIQCQFAFAFYPFDTHSCNVIFTSFFHTNQIVEYSSWELIDESEEIQHALKYDVEYNKIMDDMFREVLNYSTCGFNVKLTRHLEAAFINKFMPSFMIVMIAFCRYQIPNDRVVTQMKYFTYFSFWIPPSSSIPGRMGLLITAYLVLTNMSTSTQEFDASIFTAMDAWFVACRLLVGAALFEFALLIKLISNENKIHPQQYGIQYEIDDRCRLYDKITFWAFSSSFILFAFVYGVICMSH